MRSDASPPRWPWVGLALVVAAGFTAWMLDWSFEHGRLALPPDYDDSVYMQDALLRLDAVEAEGLGALAGGYVAERPHAPLSSVLALVGFGALGRHDWAPYVMNGLLVLLLLLGVDHLMRGAWPVARVLALLFVLSLRFTGMLVTEFRPDIACGLLAAFGAALLLRAPLAGRRRRALVGVGLSFGFALLAKPSVTPMTLGILGLAWGVAALRDAWMRREGACLAGALAALGWIAATAIALALPHALVHGREVAAYIWSGIWGPARVLGEVQLPPLATLRYYVDGDGGAHMLFRHAALVAALPVLCLAWLACMRHTRRLADALAYLFVTLVVYGVVTLNHVKTQFLGAPLYGLVLFGCVLLLRGIVRAGQEGRLPPIVARALVGAFVGGAVLLFAWPIPRAQPDAYEARRRTLRGVHDAIEAHRGADARLFVTSIGRVNHDLVRYWQRRDRKPPIGVIKSPLPPDWPAIEARMRRADVVVASEPGNSEVFDHLADPDRERRVLAWLRAAPAFEEVAVVPSHAGPAYRVFVRRGGR